MRHVEVERRVAGPRQAVWDAYTDYEGWTRWAGLGRVRLETEGAPQRHGVGAVREIRMGGIVVLEEVLTFEPPERMTYRVVRGGLPMRDHLGEVVFEEVDGGTDVTWRCRFESRVPGLGPALEVVVATAFRRALWGLRRRRFAG